MAFSGSATVTSLGKNIVHITGITLGAGASGTISDSTGSGNIKLPSSFPGILFGITMVLLNITTVPLLRPFVVNTLDGIITITSQETTESGNIEIFVQNPHSIIR